MAKRMNRAEFEAAIKADSPVIIEFYSDSCVPCKRLSPLLAEIEEANPDLIIGKVNAAYEADLAAELSVTSTPTLLFYRSGIQAGRISGAVRKAQLEEAIAEYR